MKLSQLLKSPFQTNQCRWRPRPTEDAVEAGGCSAAALRKTQNLSTRRREWRGGRERSAGGRIERNRLRGQVSLPAPPLICYITYGLLIGNNVGRSPKFFLVFLFDGLAFLILSSSRSIQIYPSFLLTPTSRAFTSDPPVRLHPDRPRSLCYY